MALSKEKKAKLAKAGGRVTTVDEFLDLNPADAAMVEFRTQLAVALRARRSAEGLTQAQLGKRIGSTQAQVARMENASPRVTLDLVLRALLAVSPKGVDMHVGGRAKAKVRAA